jgi:hypothetical protein
VNESWKPIVPGGTIYEDERDLLTGEWSFRHDVITTNRAGIAIVAVEVPQAKIGFLYAPLLDDDPMRVPLLDDDKVYTQHQSEMHAVSLGRWKTKLRVSFHNAPPQMIPGRNPRWAL